MDNILLILPETMVRCLFSRPAFTQLSLSKSELFTKEGHSDRDNVKSSSAQAVANPSKPSQPTPIQGSPSPPSAMVSTQVSNSDT